MLKRFLMVAAGAAMLMAPVGVALAQDAQAAYDKRVALMKQIGANFGGKVNRVAQGQAEFGPDTVAAAEALVALGKELPGAFPAGSNVTGSSAKPEIWSNRADFDTKVANFQEKAAALLVAVKTGDKAQITPASQAMGGACGACHTPYRTPK